MLIPFLEHSHWAWILIFNFYKLIFDMKHLFTIMVIPFILTACSEDFLDKQPEDSITSGNFYETQDQLEQALNGAYVMVRDTKAGGYAMAEMRSDNTHYYNNLFCDGGQEGSPLHVDSFIDISLAPNVAEMWIASYIGIARANVVIDNISAVDMTQQDADLIEGQAKFLRALFYFDLVRYFGGVPLYLSQVGGIDDAYLPRSTVTDVYNIIEADLLDAITKLQAPTFDGSGSATKSSARMLLAEVYLTQKDFSKAENELMSITQMGHDLLDNYADVYELSNKNSLESIFEVQYMQGNQGQDTQAFTTVNSYNFLPQGDVSLITGFAGNNGPCSTSYNMPTGDLISVYEPNDTRLDASIGIAEGSTLGVYGDIKIDVLKSPVGYTTPPDRASVAYIKKYFHSHAQQYIMDENFPVYRYSDVLLSLAEALNEQSKTSEALPHLNRVRTRAGLEAVTETDQTLLRDIIAHERRVEFAFEHHRWFDLLRTDKAIEVMNAHGEYIQAAHGDQGYLIPTGYNVTQDRLLYPIPFREVQIANIKQNPGY
tara:strand:+ start:5778 stop:7403 length:1626 start_codon:yes stop_codon:yes gene_type:complete